MKQSQHKLPPEQIRRFATTARKVDAEEGGAIRHQAREVFRRHEEIRAAINALKTVRQRQNMSLAEVARRSGISKPNLSRLENNVRVAPTLDTLQRYAKALGKVVHLQIAAA